MSKIYEKIEQQLNAIPAINPQAKDLTSTDGFISWFEQLIKFFPTRREAYERVEETHFRVFGKRKYSEWVTFKSIYYRRIRKR